MPEGDTLHRAAIRLRPALAGLALQRFEAPRLLGNRPLLGATIRDVEAVGKHLLVHFDDGLTLRTHLGMAGSWHLYRSEERWRKPRHLLRALVGVNGWDAVCFSAPQVQTYRPSQPGGPLGTGRDPIGHLGPDLCTPDVDLDEAVGRFETVAQPDAEIAVVLLDQRVVAGVGNVYKSELLHRCRVDPFVAVKAVPIPVRRQLVEAANRLLLLNLATTRRTTVAGPAGSVAVYGKARRPCPRCGTPIRMVHHGIQNRSTYWCPRCQPPGAAGLPSLLPALHQLSRPHQEPPSEHGQPSANPENGRTSPSPSIEHTNGHPIAHWQQLIRSSDLTKHIELVTWLRAEHGLGHGQANALVRQTLLEHQSDT